MSMWDLSAFRGEGIQVLPQTFEILPQFLDHLSSKPVYDNHVRQQKPPNPGGVGSYSWMCHDMHDVILAPGLLELGLQWTPAIREYFGSQAYLFSFNVFHTEPTGTPKGDIQEYHRDADDVDFIALFVYCTDVNDDQDGAHQYKMGTHLGGGDGPVKAVYGKAGTMFIEAPKGLHRGLIPQRSRRTLAWVRWGITDTPAAYGWDKLTPLNKDLIGDRYPTDPSLQEAIKLVVA